MPEPPRPDLLPEDFDLGTLLAPIPGEAPEGADLRQDFSAQSPYFRLRDARAEAREAERRADSLGGAEAEGAPPQWRVVAQLATEALAGRTKDLEIAAWLTEALVRAHGLRGLTAGALLLRGLAEGFWTGLHPQPDEDGMATRLAPVTGLSGAEADGTLMQALRRLPLLQRPDGQPLAWWQYEQSQELAGIADKARRDQRIAAGVLPFEEVEALAQAADPARFGRLRGQLAAAREAWTAMGRALDALASPADGPSTGRVAGLLDAMAEAVARFAPVAEEEPAAPAGTTEGPAGTTAVPRSAQADREGMLRQLDAIAAHFRRTEPNSPLSYTLEEAVRRARMTWPELLGEVVADERARTEILTALGIRPPPQA